MQGTVCWKKLPHEITEANLTANPACDGFWIRKNFPSRAPVDGYSWEFVPGKSLPGQGDAGNEPWINNYSVDNLKMLAAERGYSGFVTYKAGPLKNKVCWKKMPYQLTAAHLKDNPQCDGTWIRNMTPVGQVTTVGDDDGWGFIAERSIPGVGDVGATPLQSNQYTIDQLK